MNEITTELLIIHDELLKEDPDQCGNNNWSADDAHTFMWIDNELWIAGIGDVEHYKTHYQLYKCVVDDNPVGGPRSGDRIRWPGRLWTKNKTIALWYYPETKSDRRIFYSDMISYVDDFDQYKIEIRMRRMSEPHGYHYKMLVSISTFLDLDDDLDEEGRTDEILYDEERDLLVSNDEYVSESIIRGMLLKEECDEINNFDGKYLCWKDDDAVPFLVYKDDIIIGEIGGIHGDIFGDAEDRKLYGHPTFAGRVWFDSKLLSFWDSEYGFKNITSKNLQKLLPKLQEKLEIYDVDFRDGWFIEIHDKFATLEDFLNGKKLQYLDKRKVK